MVKYKLVWSNNAKIKLFEILEFYRKRNQSDTYSKKLYKKFIKEVSVLIKHPYIGLKTDVISVRGLIIDHYIVFYELSENQIYILVIWDTRQEPKHLK